MKFLGVLSSVHCWRVLAYAARLGSLSIFSEKYQDGIALEVGNIAQHAAGVKTERPGSWQRITWDCSKKTDDKWLECAYRGHL